MLNFFKKIIVYLRTIEIYEKKNSVNIRYSKNLKLKIYKKFINIKNKKTLEYFKIYKDKKLRFDKNCSFITLINGKDLVSSGWIYKGRRWKITEINEYIDSLNKLIIFDFITPKEFRNKGYYTKLLKLICSKFKNKNILIYVLSSNVKSKKAIMKAGFYFKKNLRKLY